MKKIYLWGLIIFLSLGGCAIQRQRENCYTKVKPIKQKVKVHIFLEKQSLSRADIKKKMLEKAEKQGIDKVAKTWLNKSLVFVGATGTSHSSVKKVYAKVEDDFIPLWDKIAGLYEEKFWFEATLVPTPQNSGVISGVEGGYSLATNHILISLKGDIPAGDKAFFIIARENSFGVGNYYQLIGVGKIYHVVGKIAQGEILTSNEEISTGDNIFILSTRLYPIKKGEAPKNTLEEKRQSLPVVKVRPVIEHLKNENAPKEMK